MEIPNRYVYSLKNTEYIVHYVILFLMEPLYWTEWFCCNIHFIATHKYEAIDYMPQMSCHYDMLQQQYLTSHNQFLYLLHSPRQ